MSPSHDEQQYRHLVQALPNIGVVLYATDLTVTLVEGGDFVKQGVLDVEPVGLPVGEFLTQLLGEHPDEELALFNDVFKGETHTFEQISGEKCFVLNLVPLRNNEDEIYAGMAVIRDITQRVRVAEKLTNLANQLKLLNNLGQSVVLNRDIHSVFEEVLKSTCEMVDAQAALIFLVADGQLLIEAQEGDSIPNLVGKGMPTAQGIAGEVYREQESILLTGEVCRTKLFKPLAEHLGFTPLSFLVIPITWRDRKFGVLEAIHDEEGQFTQEDLNVAESATAWAAIALNNVFQIQKLERSLAETEATSRLLKEILSSELSLKSVLQHVVEAGKDIVPSIDWAAIHLFDERENRLRLEAAAGIRIQAQEYTLEYGQGIAGRVLASGQLINVPDVSQDDRVVGYPRLSQARSLLVAPIKNHEDASIGTLTLQATRIDRFTEDDENLLQLLARQAGLAIHNARLYETAEHRRQVAQVQRERLRQLANLVVTAQEEERERIARELHDEAGQSLVSLKISLEMLGKSLPPDMGEIREALSDAAGQAEHTLASLRSLAHNLRPPALDRLGLNLALEGLCEQFESQTGIHTDYKGVEIPRLPASYEITIYRFVQEALTNIAKHADATEVEVRLGAQTGRAEILVQDNGKGMQTSPLDLEQMIEKGMGLAGMEERLKFIDGKLELQSALGRGTQLCASVPLRIREVTT